MTEMNERDAEIEEFIADWHWDKRSHEYAVNLCRYLFGFLDALEAKGLSRKTVTKHTDNCWLLGSFQCQYGFDKRFDAGKVFSSPEASFESELTRKVSDSDYAMQSYRSTWSKLYKYTKSLGLTD